MEHVSKLKTTQRKERYVYGRGYGVRKILFSAGARNISLLGTDNLIDERVGMFSAMMQ